MGCGGINPIVGFRGFNLVQNQVLKLDWPAGLATIMYQHLTLYHLREHK